VKAVLIAILALAVVGWAGRSEFDSARHRLTTEREAVDAAWLQVDLALSRRADLLPGLAEAVKTATGHDTGISASIVEARAALNNARTPQEKIAANERLSSALARLLILTENYPKLDSNRHFLLLQDEVAGAENRVAVERRKYNETLERYNSSLQMFPGNVVAALAGFTRDDAYFRTVLKAHTPGRQ
jgi:LemA protein